MPGQLATLYAAIRTRAPSAIVVVVGYPRIFNGEDCNALTWFSPAEEARLNATADLINAKTAATAAAAGFRFANPTTPFVGHAVCDSPEWLNGLSLPISESYHPNRSGHASGYTPTVSPQLTGAVVAVTRAVLSAARAAGDEQAALQSTYAAGDSGSRPSRSGCRTCARPGSGLPPSGTASTSTAGWLGTPDRQVTSHEHAYPRAAGCQAVFTVSVASKRRPAAASVRDPRRNSRMPPTRASRPTASRTQGNTLRIRLSWLPFGP